METHGSYQIGDEFLIISLISGNSCSVILQATKNLIENLPAFWIEEPKRRVWAAAFDCRRPEEVPEGREPEMGI